MLPLKERLAAIVAILNESNKRLEADTRYDGTGYLCFKPELLAKAVEDLHAHKPNGTSLDMGCGHGGWLLLVAAAGYTSYGIEIHPLLVDEARINYNLCVERNLIDPTTQVHIAIGNFYPANEKIAFEAFRDIHRENPSSMPWDDVNPYELLGVTLFEMDIIYTWSWPAQSRFLYNFLERTAKHDAIFILPAYIRYTQGEHMNASLNEPNKLILSRILTEGEVFIGRQVD